MEEARADCSERDLQALSDELENERQMREMLDQSASELRNTVSLLEKRLDNVEDEGNEWKTRYETQQELNIQLERQIRILEEKVEYIRGSPTDRLSSVRSYEEMPVIRNRVSEAASIDHRRHLHIFCNKIFNKGALKQLIKQLEKEKKSLQNQLKNYEWRIDQEAKAYHKSNDERRTYLTEIAQASLTIETAKKQKAIGSREKKVLKGKYNVPTTQRILDLKKGPIKKTTAMKQLPKLNH